eukprot:4363944-Pleurochrysis_carterae.AAC.2
MKRKSIILDALATSKGLTIVRAATDRAADRRRDSQLALLIASRRIAQTDHASTFWHAAFVARL